MSVTNDDFLDSGAAANLMGLRKATLAKLRVTGGGPVFIKAGRKVLYKKEDAYPPISLSEYAPGLYYLVINNQPFPFMKN